MVDGHGKSNQLQFNFLLFDEVKYVMGESIQHGGTCESIKKLIKERPTAVITIYKIEHLLEYLMDNPYISYPYDFSDVVRRMIELDTTIRRNNKLESLIK